MQFIKDNVMALLIGVLVVVLLLTGISLASTKASLASTQAQLTTAQANQLVLQSDLDGLTLDLRASESENQRLRKDVELTAALLSNREHSRRDVDKSAADAAAKTAAIIKDSDDEAVTNWVATPVPIEFNRLLKRAANCAHGDNDPNSVCVAAAGVDEPMRNSNVLRQNQSRSL